MTNRLPRGSMKSMTSDTPNGSLYFTAWQDNKPAHMLSTFPTCKVEVSRVMKKKSGGYS